LNRSSLIGLIALLLFPALNSADAGPRKKLNRAEREIARAERQIKRAEQEGFERHDLKRYLSAFSKNAVWVYARGSEPSEHEYIHTYAQHRMVFQKRWRSRPGNKQLHFRHITTKREGDHLVALAEVALSYQGGKKSQRRRYKLAKQGAKWRIIQVRSWPLTEQTGPEFTNFAHGGWSELDKEAERALIDKTLKFKRRMRYLIDAHWITRAYELSVNQTQAHPKDAQGWRSRAEVGFVLGYVKEARRYARRARDLDETIPLSEYVLSR
jgi:hypothetical protein